MKFTYSYGAKKGNKLWIDAYYKEGRISYNVSIEINIKEKGGRINWINKRINLGKDNFIDSIDKKIDEQLLKESLEYAINKGYIKE